MLKSELIVRVQSIYPYYTRLNNMKKSELLYLYNKDCAHIPVRNAKNSCYLDSLLVALFIGDVDKKIYNLLISNESQHPTVVKIRDQLKSIYNIITGKTYRHTVCSRLRHNLDAFYKEYQRTHNVDDIDWKTDQVDPTQLLELLIPIFNTPNMLTERISVYASTARNPLVRDLVSGATRVEHSAIVHNITVSNLIGKRKINLKDIFPNRKEVEHLDAANLYRLNGRMFPTKITKTNVLASPIIYVNIDRVSASGKLATKITPFQKLKLIENRLPIYLKSIIVHYGNAGGGHYVCAFECRDDWYLYDDMEEEVEEIGKFEDLLARNDLLENSKAFIYA